MEGERFTGRLGINSQASQKPNPLKRVALGFASRLGINSQANQKPNPLKRVAMFFLTCFSRFEGLSAWEFIPRRFVQQIALVSLNPDRLRLAGWKVVKLWAGQNPNPLKRVAMVSLTCFSRFEGLSAWEFIPRLQRTADSIGLSACEFIPNRLMQHVAPVSFSPDRLRDAGWRGFNWKVMNQEAGL